MPYICGGEMDEGQIMSMSMEMKCPHMVVRDTDTVCQMDHYPQPTDYIPEKINLPMRLNSTVPVCSTISAPTNTRLTGDTSEQITDPAPPLTSLLQTSSSPVTRRRTVPSSEESSRSSGLEPSRPV